MISTQGSFALEKVVSFEVEEECEEALQEEDEKGLDRKTAFSFALFLFRVHVTNFFRAIDMSGLFRQIRQGMSRGSLLFSLRESSMEVIVSVSNGCWPGLN